LSNPWAKSLIVIVICAALAFIFSGPIVWALSVLSHTVSNTLSGLVPQGLRSAATLQAENQDLRDKVTLLLAQNSDRTALAAENISLKAMLGRVEKEKIIYAIVLQKPPISPYDTFILDVGARNGVKVGNIITVGNLAIGIILETNTGTSKAELFSSPQKVFEGRLGSKGISIQATGQGGGTFESLVPIGTIVSEGDALVLPSVSTKVFGIVEKVETLEEEGFKKVLFGLPINPSLVSNVGVRLE